MARNSLTVMQHAFCREYVKNGMDKCNESLLAAGYSKDYIKKKRV